MHKKRWIFLAKLLVSGGIIAYVIRRVLLREGADELWDKMSAVVWPWLGAAATMQLCAIATSVLRWQRLLVGQGIRAPARHLVGSFMIGRFFGAFTPGGWTGLNGYRLYDIAVQTGKVSRSTAVIGIEMVLGYLAFGVVLVAGSTFGLRVIGIEWVLLVDAIFVMAIGLGLVLIMRPALFRLLGGTLPVSYRSRLQSVIDAVCAYQGQGTLVVQAAALGVGTHTFNSLIYVSTARAFGVTELGIGEIFFVSTVQILATLFPASVNGIGVREATAIELYSKFGVAQSVGFLIPTLGFAVEMLISSVGGLVFLARRVGYSVEIQVEHAEREKLNEAQIEHVPAARRPSVTRGVVVGMGAGLFGGMIVGVGEALVTLASSAERDFSVLSYAGCLYGLSCGLFGAGLGGAMAASGRLMQREAEPEPRVYGRLSAAIVAGAAFVLGAFRVRRDLFHEELVWKSGRGLAVLLACLFAAAALYAVLRLLLRPLMDRAAGRFLLTPWGTPALGAACMLLLAMPALGAQGGAAEPVATRPRAPKAAGNLLFLVVDTLRADHLPAYGYRRGSTPHLDAFARDAVRFDQAFANASWTRPSFASILTGRYAASHHTMAKADALPDELVTLPEALRAGGYTTLGVATNYNVAPFFNFHQGFDDYRYLEPSYVLFANDTSSKLLMVQLARRIVEKLQPARPGSVYKDAEQVNREILDLLERKPRKPWFVFAGYMDPHDPYYAHPYDGAGYARSTHQRPRPEEAPRLQRLYDGEITYWDHHFGQLLSALKERNLYEDLTVVVTSDHGEEFMDHGGYWHGTTLYDEQIRVPLLLKLPDNARGGTTVYHWVQSIDLMPTLLARAGLEIPQGVQGRDAFVGSDEVFAEESHEGNVLGALRLKHDHVELKLITANRDNPRGLETRELYELDSDPGEQENLAHARLAELTHGEQRLDQYRQQAAEGAVAPRSVNVAADQAAIDRLRALGYAAERSTSKPKLD
ncbi:MAG: sulfatase-like hydrolase/transferase [Proteobacteria bacterium]|nr:sulfatase-like hydrolase/transferase [Pseudomonadota bacterium]